MTETGEVPLSSILTILRKHLVTVSGGKDDIYTFAKGDRVESFKLGASVSRHMAQKIARTYKVPVHEFYGSVITAPTPIDIAKPKRKPA